MAALKVSRRAIALSAEQLACGTPAGAPDPWCYAAAAAKVVGDFVYDSTFSRTVWKLYGGAKGLVACYCTPRSWGTSSCAARRGGRRGSCRPRCRTIRAVKNGLEHRVAPHGLEPGTRCRTV